MVLDQSQQSEQVRSPVLGICAVLTAGISLASVKSTPEISVIIYLLIIVCSLIWCIRIRKKSSYFLVFMVLWMLLGMLRYEQTKHRTDPVLKQLLAQSSKIPVKITGTVITTPIYHPVPRDQELTPRPQSPKTTFDLSIRSLDWNGNSQKVLGTLKVTLAEQKQDLQIASLVTIYGYLSSAGLPTNPHDFNYREYLTRKGIDGLLWCEHPEALSIENHHSTSFIFRLKQNIRQYLAALFDKNLGTQDSPLAKSLILGDRSELPDELTENFFVTGLMHILAISGFHMGILWGLCLGLFTPVRNRFARHALALLILWGFAWLVDTGPPVQRAVMMATLFVSSEWLQRKPNSLSIWGMTLLLVLLYDPQALFDLGAQLSFLAVLIIIEYQFIKSLIFSQLYPVDPLADLSNTEANNSISRWKYWLLDNLGLSLMITLILAPLTILRFYIISPYSGILSLLLLPFVTLLLILLFLFPLLSLFPLICSISIWTIKVLIHSIAVIVNWGEWLPGSYFRVPPMPLWWTLGIYLLLLIFWVYLRVIPRPAIRLKIPFATAFMLIIAAGPVYSMVKDRQQHGQLQITALDVGHGGAILIQFPNRRVILYDCGSINGPERAKRAVLCGLRDLGISRLDAVVISHADLDHFNGLSSLLKTTTLSSLYISPSLVDLKRRGLSTTFESLISTGVNIYPLQTGDELNIDPQVKVKIIHPDANPAHWGIKDNENSIIMKLEFNQRSVLLTGDIEGEASQRLTFQETSPVDLLFAPHHGSKFANTLPFAYWAKPSIVFICHEDPEVTKRMQQIYQQTSEHILCTGDGACRLTISSQGTMELQQYQSVSKTPDWVNIPLAD